MNKIDINYTALKDYLLSIPSTGELGLESLSSINHICSRINPNSILELGFNRGMSAIMFLKCSNANVHSVDIRPIEHVRKSIHYINNTYPNRFKYTCANHKTLFDEEYCKTFYNYYDLIFIDGDHSRNGIERDVTNSLKLNPKYILFDDYNHFDHGGYVQQTITKSNLEIIEIYNTTCGHALTMNRDYNGA